MTLLEERVDTTADLNDEHEQLLIERYANTGLDLPDLRRLESKLLAATLPALAPRTRRR